MKKKRRDFQQILVILSISTRSYRFQTSAMRNIGYREKNISIHRQLGAGTIMHIGAKHIKGETVGLFFPLPPSHLEKYVGKRLDPPN